MRNCGAEAVVEGVGDHGCEYMTGGRVVILGTTGRNFGAGMSGGIAYLLDETDSFGLMHNPEMVHGLELEPEDEAVVKELVSRHLDRTGSARAAMILDNWTDYAQKFVKVCARSTPQPASEKVSSEKAPEPAMKG